MERKGALARYSAFVFDLDGTIFSIPVDWKGVRAGLESLLGLRLDPRPLFNQLDECLVARPELRGGVFELIDSFEARAASGARPLEGALELLSELSASSRLALVTMQGRMLYDVISRRYALDALFKTSVTREDSMDRAAQLGEAISVIGSLRAETLFVGDRPNDVIASRRAGVDVALVGAVRQTAELPDMNFADLIQMRAALT